MVKMAAVRDKFALEKKQLDVHKSLWRKTTWSMVKTVAVRDKFALEKKELEVSHIGGGLRGQDGG